MTQASSNAKNPPATPTAASLGAAAAAAATTTPAKPTDAAKPADAAAGTAAGDDKKKERNGSKIFIATGTVHEFDSINKAEKFLNAEGSPAEYSVLRGKRIGTSKKVSLR